MTKRITVSLPDHLAARLEREQNASAFVADAIEGKMRGERVRQQLAASGVHITDEQLAHTRERLSELDAEWTPERRRVLREQRRQRVRRQLEDGE
jgi:metal-responsive CopG/Arc/MetJ family transcriptional regulator